MTLQELESRVIELERQLARLKLDPLSRSKPTCAQDTFGMFADDPDFDEIVRLGREYREQTFEEDWVS